MLLCCHRHQRSLHWLYYLRSELCFEFKSPKTFLRHLREIGFWSATQHISNAATILYATRYSIKRRFSRGKHLGAKMYAKILCTNVFSWRPSHLRNAALKLRLIVYYDSIIMYYYIARKKIEAGIFPVARDTKFTGSFFRSVRLVHWWILK